MYNILLKRAHLFVFVYIISPDFGFNWILFCGLHAGDNFCSRSLSSGFRYGSWWYLFILSHLTSAPTGILSVVYMPVIISVHGVCHLGSAITHWTGSPLRPQRRFDLAGLKPLYTPFFLSCATFFLQRGNLWKEKKEFKACFVGGVAETSLARHKPS